MILLASSIKMLKDSLCSEHSSYDLGLPQSLWDFYRFWCVFFSPLFLNKFLIAT